MTNENLKKLKEAIINQDSEVAVELTKRCISAGVNPKEVIDAISDGLREVGDLFEKRELFLPEVMRAANAAKMSLSLVIPLVQSTPEEKANGKARVAIGSLGPHDIGKTIVTSMLIAAGFRVMDMGIMLTPDKAEKFLKESEGTNLMGLSVLLTSDVDKSAEIIKRARSVNGSLKVMVGGAAMNPKVAKEIGADAFAKDANEAVKLAKGLKS